MPELQKNTPHVRALAFVDYKPAEIRIGKQWLIVYYAKNPITKELERFRVTIPKIESATERKKHAKKIVVAINAKLESGWLPWYSESAANQFKTYEHCYKKFIAQTAAEVAKGSKRADTLRSYTSHFSMITKYLLEQNAKLNLIVEFNHAFVVNYLDWIYYDRGNSARTHNNHLLFIGTFVNYCISRGYLKENFTTGISRKTESEKVRQVLTNDIKSKLRKLQEKDRGYFVLCMVTYYCFIRRTELTKLKVSDVNLNKSFIMLDAKISKNRKTEAVTIPNELLVLLADHLKSANNNDYVFSDDFKPGTKIVAPKKISDRWEKFRKANSIPAIYQFYSLKDTGITDLLKAGIPAIKVRDQARHHDLKITEKYTARNQDCDNVVKNSNFVF